MGSQPEAFQFSAPGPLRLYSTAELLRLPPPTWLMADIIPAGGFVALYAPPETFKSFCAIDWTLHVATGLPWAGHEVEQGLPVYVSAEGGAGIGKRVRAWLRHHNVKANDAEVAWLIDSLPIYRGAEELDTLIARIQELDTPTSFIVIDTLARCFNGDENQQEDMGRFVGGIDQLRKTTGATVVVVHHTRLMGDRERGNTAFRGAADAMVELARASDRTTPPYDLVAKCTKQKDDAHFEDIALQVVAVPEDDSCVVVPSVAVRKSRDSVDRLVQMLRALGPSRWDDWLEGLGTEQYLLHKHSTLLKKQEIIVRDNGQWRVK